MQMVMKILPLNYVDLPMNAPVNHQETWYESGILSPGTAASNGSTVLAFLAQSPVFHKSSGFETEMWQVTCFHPKN